jgi:hypothetical protein
MQFESGEEDRVLMGLRTDETVLENAAGMTNTRCNQCNMPKGRITATSGRGFVTCELQLAFSTQSARPKRVSSLRTVPINKTFNSFPYVMGHLLMVALYWALWS